jgi:hypothetical protein
MLAELTDEQKERLREWWQQHMRDGDWFYGTYGGNGSEVAVWILSPYKTDNGIYGASLHEYGAEPDSNALPLFNTGQMIEFIYSNTSGFKSIVGTGQYCVHPEEYCKELWRSVKNVIRYHLSDN